VVQNKPLALIVALVLPPKESPPAFQSGLQALGTLRFSWKWR